MIKSSENITIKHIHLLLFMIWEKVFFTNILIKSFDKFELLQSWLISLRYLSLWWKDCHPTLVLDLSKKFPRPPFLLSSFFKIARSTQWLKSVRVFVIKCFQNNVGWAIKGPFIGICSLMPFDQVIIRRVFLVIGMPGCPKLSVMKRMKLVFKQWFDTILPDCTCIKQWYKDEQRLT